MTKDGHEDTAVYDRLGVGYQYVRRPDPRLGRLIEEAVGDAETILNVGAGTGSDEPADRQVVAIEPSAVMLAQHAGSRRVRGEAEVCPSPMSVSMLRWRFSLSTTGETSCEDSGR